MARKKSPETGVSSYARKLILDGLTNSQVVTALHARFPQSRANVATVAVWRTVLRRTEPSVPFSKNLEYDVQRFVSKYGSSEAVRIALGLRALDPAAADVPPVIRPLPLVVVQDGEFRCSDCGKPEWWCVCVPQPPWPVQLAQPVVEVPHVPVPADISPDVEIQTDEIDFLF